MFKKRLMISGLLALLITALLLPASPILAANGNNGNGQGQGQGQSHRVTPAERLAAAQALKASGVAVAAAAPVINPATGHLIPDYFGAANWAFSPPMQKFVDALPTIPAAVADTTTFPGSDYYVIELGQYTQKMHSSLPATTLRGYRQVNTTTAANQFSYLGPIIVAQKDRPVRIKFINSLPTGTGGNLFLPVDDTVMGAGMGPDGVNMYTQNRATLHLHGNDTVWISDGTPHQWITPANETTPYPQGVSVHAVPDMASVDPGNPTDGIMTFYYTNTQSARLMFYHDHAYGITRLNVYAGEAAGYYIDDPVEEDLEDGTNLTGVNPTMAQVLPQENVEIPLIIQDKTFVDPATIGTTDPTWLDPTQPTFGTVPGTAVAGDLWYPHVYLPNQNPANLMGANPFGRWDYGPWFYPPVPNAALIQGPVPNPYYISPTATPWENPTIPGTPELSVVGEAFMDTPVVNGMAYPYMSVEPKAYRFHILNAADDRMFDLQMYVANPGIVGSLTTTSGSGYTANPVVTVTNAVGDTTGNGFTLYATTDLTPGSLTLGQVTFSIRTVGSNYTLPPVINVTRAPGDITGTGATATAVLYTLPTEVGMVPTPEITIPPYDASGVPDPNFAGPNFWQIGTEGGFLPAPVDIPNQHITFNLNPKTFNFGNVVNHSLLIGTAERADVVVDFSAFAGKTIILYNDAPAPLPAADPRTDYYTCDQDNTATGGAPSTLPGFGPNTRTVMQFVVAPAVITPGPAITLASLEAAWAKTATQPGVFASAQKPIIIPQAAYNSAYNNTFDSTAAGQYIQIGDTSKTFQPIDANGVLQPAVTIPLQEKASHDEMSGVYDRYARMQGTLGLSLPATTSTIAQFLPYGYASPPVDLIDGSISSSPVVTLGDGTQIWRFTQNGVDTHTIHVHLVNAQLINRVGWDGMMIAPDPNELGWKETFRVNPLEQTFIAFKAVPPDYTAVPFLDQIPNSVRLIDPTMPEGATLTPPPPAGWFDPNGVAVTSILNHYVNFGWEYVYHCHILAHEENDMMHSLDFLVPPKPATNLIANEIGNGSKTQVVLTWTGVVNASDYTVQRATANTGPWTTIATVAAPTTTFTDPIGNTKTVYWYQVIATNTIGDTQTPGFPTMSASAAPSAPSMMQVYPPAAPTGVSATATVNSSGKTDRITLTWTASVAASGYTVQMATNSSFTTGLVTTTVGAAATSWTSGNVPRTTNFYLRIQATNSAGASAWVNATPFPILTP